MREQTNRLIDTAVYDRIGAFFTLSEHENHVKLPPPPTNVLCISCSFILPAGFDSLGINDGTDKLVPALSFRKTITDKTHTRSRRRCHGNMQQIPRGVLFCDAQPHRLLRTCSI